MSIKTTTHFVTPAPGHYGDQTRVISSHKSVAAARRAAKASGSVQYVVREGSLQKGHVFRRSAESIYPVR